MPGILPVEGFGVTEDSGGFLEGHAVFLQVAQGFPGVPREHITVYTLIQRGCKEEAAQISQVSRRYMVIPLISLG